MWALRGLRNGVLTTRWPARPDEYAASTRGPATVLTPGTRPSAEDGRAGLASLCPAGAISQDDGGAAGLDQGLCIQCGRCVAARPDLFGWQQGPGSAALTRPGLVVPPTAETPRLLAEVQAGLRARTRALRRSVHLRHVDAGSDGTEEWEILALLNPVYDIHRLGLFFTASPRHADILLVTGAGAGGMAEPLRQTYDAMPHPKLVIAVGTDAVGGGLPGSSYATAGGVGGIVPVDVWLPGSPPSPFSILYALLLALGRLSAEAGDQR
jgi:Ni,Fe-hydrogenase III small subunit/ferredoxin-like protein FixX